MQTTQTLSMPTPTVKVAPPTWPAEALALGAILLGAAFMRLFRLGGSSGDLDEGIRGIQLLLMSAGYRPVGEIYSSQGPLLLDMLHPLYRLFGETLGAARLAVGSYSLLGIVGVYLAARLVGGPVGGVAAAALLALSPSYLRGSRQALAEVPALAPAVLAVVAAVAYQRGGRWPWLAASGVLLGLALLVKPITVAAVVPIGVAAMLGPRRGVRPLFFVGAVSAAVVAAIVLLTGLPAVLDQMVEYRLRSREASGWSLAENWKLLQSTLGRDGLGIFALAGVGGLALLLARPRRALPLVLWPLASLGLLLVYSPLFAKHAVVVLPPSAVLAGAGLGRVWQGLRGREWPGMIGAFALVAPALFYLWSLPQMVDWHARFMNLGPSTEGERFSPAGDAAATVAALTARGDFVVTDHPELAFLAQRLVPPELADPSKSRVQARQLTGQEIVAAATAADARLVVLWTDRLRTLRAFTNWLDDRFEPIKVYGRGGDSPRVVYLRDDADFTRARTALEPSAATQSAVDFGGILRLRGFSLDRTELSRAGAVGVTYHWEALGRTSVDYHIRTELRGPDGQVRTDESLSLGGRNIGLTEWQPGRWLFQSSAFELPAGASAGEYTLTLGVHDSRAKQELPITAGDPRLGSRSEPIHRFEIGTVRVR